MHIELLAPYSIAAILVVVISAIIRNRSTKKAKVYNMADYYDWHDFKSIEFNNHDFSVSRRSRHLHLVISNKTPQY